MLLIRGGDKGSGVVSVVPAGTTPWRLHDGNDSRPLVPTLRLGGVFPLSPTVTIYCNCIVPVRLGSRLFSQHPGNPVTRFWRPLLLIALVLLVPIVPFVLVHEPLQQWVGRFVDHPPPDWAVVALVIGLLGADVFLPVPSSFVSTLAGSQLSLVGAVLASWLGMNLGAVVGFVVGRRLGRPLAERLSSASDLRQMEQLCRCYGSYVLVLTRALPILAEAAVLLVGLHRMKWKQFLPPVLLSNLGIACAYALLGNYSAQHEWLPAALAISVALPLLLATLLRKRPSP